MEPIEFRIDPKQYKSLSNFHVKKIVKLMGATYLIMFIGVILTNKKNLSEIRLIDIMAISMIFLFAIILISILIWKHFYYSIDSIYKDIAIIIDDNGVTGKFPLKKISWTKLNAKYSKSGQLVLFNEDGGWFKDEIIIPDQLDDYDEFVRLVFLKKKEEIPLWEKPEKRNKK